ncbi:MAG: DUF2793 domain-containing protein [Mesorhizobium sp.]|nr:DUF2793 domain-containing protein [Mesorhizobium sp.]
MTDRTTNLKFPYILPSQAQKHVTHNEALRELDIVVQLSVLDRGLGAPPVTPVEGDRYIVGSPATGAWAGHAAEVAAWQDGGWRFAAPSNGWLAWVASEDRLLVFDGADWVSAVTGALNPAPMVGVNATADVTNRLAVASQASLFDNEGGDHRLKINKATVADTSSVLFQTGYSGRIELGAAGDDAFRVKVSADGVAWKTALAVDPATGFLGIGTDAPEGPLHILRAGSGPIHERVDDATGAPAMNSRKARGTPAARTSVLDGDVVQGFFAQGFDGTAYVGCANLRWIVDGAPSTGSVPTRLEFWTFTPGVGHNEKMRVTPGGNVGIGVTAPTTRLQVAGPVRTGQYAKAALPSAASSGAGAIVYVSDEAGGAVLAFSDGSAWRRVTDRAVVS